jgi:hypothetical protein
VNINKIDFQEYVAGWLFTSGEYPINLDMNNMKAALHNALAMLEDEQDRIKATTKRFEYYKQHNMLTHEE